MGLLLLTSPLALHAGKKHKDKGKSHGDHVGQIKPTLHKHGYFYAPIGGYLACDHTNLTGTHDPNVSLEDTQMTHYPAETEDVDGKIRTAKETLATQYTFVITPGATELVPCMATLAKYLKHKKIGHLIWQLGILEDLTQYQKPKIVLYASRGKDNAQQLLNELIHFTTKNKKLKKMAGITQPLPYTYQINSLLAFIQGDAKDRSEAIRTVLFKEYFTEDGVYFHPDFTGVKTPPYLTDTEGKLL